MSEITDQWSLCFKVRPAFVRTVRGERERVDTREGITWAYAETDYVMCGPSEAGAPDSSDVYPIKKETFRSTYRVEAPEVEGEPTLRCRETGEVAFIVIEACSKFLTSYKDVPKRLENYEFNPQRGQTILDVVRDEDDQRGSWTTKVICCSSCEMEMSASHVLSHFEEE